MVVCKINAMSTYFKTLIDGFNREKEFYYRITGIASIPMLIVSDERFLLLELVTGDLLDTHYESSIVDPTQIKFFIDKFIWFYTDLELNMNGRLEKLVILMHMLHCRHC